MPGSTAHIDGISFYKQLFGDYSSKRPWIFCHFVGSPKTETNPLFLRRWMQNNTFKQYDVLPNPQFSKKFFNIVLDPEQRHPISIKNMTLHEKEISTKYLVTMSNMH